MGVSVGFVRATAEELDRAWREPERAEPYVWELYDSGAFRRDGRLHCGPAKPWAGPQFLFAAADVQLEFLMHGFMTAEDGTPVRGDRGAVHRARRPVAGDVVGAAGGPLRPRADGTDDVCPNLREELVAFVTGAAERGQGAFMGFVY